MQIRCNRRDSMKWLAAGGLATATGQWLNSGSRASELAGSVAAAEVDPNMIGVYGPWAASLVGDEPARLSFRHAQFQHTAVDDWRPVARQRVLDCLLQPQVGPSVDVRVERTEQYDGLQLEFLSWQLPYGPRTEGLFLKPVAARGRLPAILGLHDHGGMKFFGYPKITRSNAPLHPIIERHQADCYGGVGWANEIAKRGYAVLVHDTFTFGSRRVQRANLPVRVLRDAPLFNADSTVEKDVQNYNRFAAQHEHLMAKSLFCAGTTWPGVFTVEDQRALDYLASRPDVDPQRMGCAGLSGGGLRTVYLGGLDERIRCACCAGMMSTWRDYLLHKAYTHTWMIYIPGLARDLDYPEVLGLRAPLPTLVLNNDEDALFTLPEMKRADRMLQEVFAKAGASDAYRASFYPGSHKFDLAMQNEAFDWFDRWLR